MQPNHSAWQSAVSRLGDLGDGFTLELIKKLKVDSLKQNFLTGETRRIEERLNSQMSYLEKTQDAQQIEQYIKSIMRNKVYAMEFDQSHKLVNSYKMFLFDYVKTLPQARLQLALSALDLEMKGKFSQELLEELMKLIRN